VSRKPAVVPLSSPAPLLQAMFPVELEATQKDSIFSGTTLDSSHPSKRKEKGYR